MSKKRKAPRVPGRPVATAREGERKWDPPVEVGAGALVLALICVGLAVDSGADASFDAPKRLTSLFFVCLAAGALAFSAWKSPFAGDRPVSARSLALILAAGALVWAALSALLSPRSPAALDATRTMFLWALLLPIGASRLLERRGGLLLGAFLAVAAVNAVISVLQARGLYQPFALVTDFGSRESTGAYVGNVGYLALFLALASVAAASVLLSARRGVLRAAAGAAALLFVGGLLASRNLTALSALAAGAAILCVALFGRRSLFPMAAAALLIAVGVLAYRPMRERVAGAIEAARAGDWNQLVTYRVGAWKAAVAMTRERPLFGYGPGTFGAEYVPHRLAVEISSRRRYENPLRTSSFGEAHCDYLQAFAEAGLPAGFAGLAAVFLLFAGLVRALSRAQGLARAEAAFLLAFLGTGAVRRAHMVSDAEADLGDSSSARRRKSLEDLRAGRRRSRGAVRYARGIGAVLLLAWAFTPELARYRAERLLRAGDGALRYLVTHPSDVTDPPAVLEHIAALALDASGGLPGDPRPWILAGGARLVKAQADLAIENYREALARGERAETDLNLGRAYEALGDPQKSRAAFLRAVWVSPALISAVLPDVAAPLRQELARLETELKDGRLKAPPPLPE